jgi:NADH dehydrogenase
MVSEHSRLEAIMASVTIFGGTGFIGRYVVTRLAENGWSVTVAVRRPDEALFLKSAGAVGQVTPVGANVRDRASVARAIDGAEAVVNLVGILYQSGAQRFQSVQAEGAGTIAQAAKSAGVKRLVHVSAIGADRQSPSLYAQSKALGEELVRKAFPDATILCPSIVFGPEDDFFNRFARMAGVSPFLPLIGGGRMRFQPVYVGDVAEAVSRALASSDCMGKTFELGGPGVYSFEQLLRLVLKEIRKQRLLLPIPFWLAGLQALALELLPEPPLTRDQLQLLRKDNVVQSGSPGLAELGIQATPLEVVVPEYLARYRPRGFYERG